MFGGSGIHMAMRPPVKRIGKTGEEIFVPHHEDASADRPKKRGRRPSHTEHWTKVTVVLFDRQIVFLDRLGADIRAARSKSELLELLKLPAPEDALDVL